MKNDIIISAPEKLAKIKEEIKKDGAARLHCLADFDRTLTTAFVKGKKISSLIAVLREKNYLTPDYSVKAERLCDKYYPLEMNPKISPTKKKKAMYEWWTRHFHLLVESGLTKKILKKAVLSAKTKFRPGAKKFFHFLQTHNIPLVIFSSAGLGTESIKIYFKSQGVALKNIFIISNAFTWDKKGKAVASKKPIIHAFNKDETVVHDFPFFKLIKKRKNVILLGDSLGDIGMITGFNYDNLLKIGFLNEDTEKNLEFYKKAYDVTILNDGPLDYVNNLLKEVI